MIESSTFMRPSRGSHRSGGGTWGIAGHWPAAGRSRSPSAALTVRISTPPTEPTARAWVVWRPWEATTTSRSITAGGRANDRYCAVAQTIGRPVLPSIAEIAAPRPHPPNRKLCPVEMPGVTGSTHRRGLWVGSRPSHSRASTVGHSTA